MTLCDPMDCSTPGFPVLHYLSEFAQTQVHWVSDIIQPSHPLASPSLLALHLSQHKGLFQWVGASHQEVKILSFSISPSNEYSEWFSLKIDWFDQFVVQESSPGPQFESISSSALRSLYGLTLTSTHDTGKTIALTRWMFVGKVMSLLLNILSMFVIGFLPRRKCLLIPCLQSPSAVILEAK